MFDDKFVWGVASSAYQVEGTDPDDGRGKTVWDTFTEQGRIFQNQNAYTSCDHMHHYKDDYALMKNLGIKAYRFSLNWARILPEGTGRVNEKAIAMYRDMILTMKENGITPYITLFHWEFPQALQEKGGWLNEEVVDWYGKDPYNKQSFTAGLCYAISDGLDWFKEKKAEFHYPVLMTHGEKDGLVSVQDTYDFFREAGSKDKQMKIYGGLFHEILNEYCKDEVIGDMIRWMEVRI